MNYSVFDIEADGLLDNATVIYCLSVKKYQDGQITSFTLTDYNEMRSFLEQEEILVGHYIIGYDIPLLEKLLQIKIYCRLIDTLALSWYLYPKFKKHGLEDWGEKVGVAKPKILDWKNLPIEEYVNRCQQDVIINDKVFTIMADYLIRIYGDSQSALRFVGYLAFKMDCAREQEEVRWKLDVETAKRNLATLTNLSIKKAETLANVMPAHITYKKKEMPKKPYTKDGSLSALGKKWFDLLEEHGFPSYYLGAIKIADKVEKGNPKSFPQLKDWLFSLGWKPINYKFVREKKADGRPDYNAAAREVPQISNDDGSDICKSVKRLYEKEPNLKELEDYFVINHRITILKGFLANVSEDGYLKATIHGFTNTLRFAHNKPLVNLPTAPKRYWKLIRGCLIAPEGHTLCGSDMSSLEDSTKQHYMYFYDPKYVMEMRTPGFDPHLDIAILAKMLTVEQADEHKLHDNTKGEQGKSYKPIRAIAKRVNFAGVYGAGPPKIALTAGITLPEAQKLHSTYWKRNKAVKQVAANTYHKIVDGQMWLFNPVSQFWYSLRAEKDKFSTLNQGTGVYCFDSWVRRVRAGGIRLCGQFHDEIIFALPIGSEENHKAILQKAIEQTNDEIKLNVPLGISVDFGHSYMDIH